MNVTVICAVWNQRRDWLLEAINSVSDAPLILADDGSTLNETRQVFEHYERLATDAAESLRVLRLPHRGMEPTLNDAIAEAATDYVAILDSDDRRVRNSLEMQCAHLDQHPEVVAVHGRFNYIDQAGTVLIENTIHPTPCHSSLVFRKSAWSEVGGYPTGFTFGEGDSHFIAKLSTIGKVEALPILCAARRVHPKSLSFPNQPRLQRILREADERR